VGVGAATVFYNIMKKGFLQPIAYASRILSKPEKNYPQIECELFCCSFRRDNI